MQPLRERGGAPEARLLGRARRREHRAGPVEHDEDGRVGARALLVLAADRRLRGGETEQGERAGERQGPHGVRGERRLGKPELATELAARPGSHDRDGDGDEPDEADEQREGRGEHDRHQ